MKGLAVLLAAVSVCAVGGQEGDAVQPSSKTRLVPERLDRGIRWLTAYGQFPKEADAINVPEFKATATLNGAQVGCHFSTNAVHVDLKGPIACQVGYRREKTVLVYGGVGEQIFFTANDPTLLEVSVKAPVNPDGEVILYLKTLKRGTPILQVCLG